MRVELDDVPRPGPEIEDAKTIVGLLLLSR